MLTEADIYGHGKPTRLAFATRDVSQSSESLPVSLSIASAAPRSNQFSLQLKQ